MNSKFLITSLQRSLCYLTYCMIQLTVSTALLVYVFFDRNNLNQPVVVGLELLLTITIMVDILLKAINEGMEFFKAAWNLVDVIAFSTILLCICLFQYFEVFYDEIFGISLISIRYLSLSIRIVIVLKQYITCLIIIIRSYLIQMLQNQRDILIYKKSKHNDLSILDISSDFLCDSDFVETMKLVNE